MTVFVSWSGQRSKALALALRTWLSDVFYDVQTWMSAHDLNAGSRWGPELSIKLNSSNFGILCLTPENLNSPWMLFESGALAKSLDIASVVPYLIGLSMDDINYPLAQFQGVSADESGTLRLLESINMARSTSLSRDTLHRLFTKWWPDLQEQLTHLPVAQDTVQKKRNEALLEELLELLHQQQIQPITDEDSKLIWTKARTIHQVGEHEIAAMSTVELLQYISQLKDRTHEILSPGEQSLLNRKTEMAELELQHRLPKVFRPN